jgi:hypothetical protein
VRIAAAEFFKFCSRHTALLRDLAEQSGGELSETQLIEAVRRNADESEEQQDTVVKKLKELRVVEPLEQEQGFYVVAGPLVQLIRYLLYEATPATPETIRGYVNSLDELCKVLNGAVSIEDVTRVELAVEDINRTLRRIYDDIAATHGAILGAVAEFKTGRRSISVRQKFQRIVYWMEVFVIPMIEIIRVDGVMEATLGEAERLLGLASDRTVFNDLSAVERNLRFIRLVRRHALRVFEECRKEIHPLYQALARSNDIAAGAAFALDQLRRDGLQNWGSDALAPVFSWRQQYAVSDSAIKMVLQQAILREPESPPTVNFHETEQEPAAMSQRRWLDLLPDQILSDLPMDDLIGWLSNNHPALTTSELLGAFSTLVFHDRFHTEFGGGDIRTYETIEHIIRAHPVRIELEQE